MSRHPRMLSRVDLPEPEDPMTVTNSPSVMVNVTPRRAWTVSSPTVKSRLISSSLIISFIAVLLSWRTGHERAALLRSGRFHDICRNCHFQTEHHLFPLVQTGEDFGHVPVRGSGRDCRRA